MVKRAKQKFPRGTLVRITANLPECMSHFDSDCEAIVDHTYHEAYGGGNVKSYSLLLLDESREPVQRVSWYEEDQLSLVEDKEWELPWISKGQMVLARY